MGIRQYIEDFIYFIEEYKRKKEVSFILEYTVSLFDSSGFFLISNINSWKRRGCFNGDNQI